MGWPPSMVPVRSMVTLAIDRNVDSEIALQLFHGDEARLEAAGVEAGFDEQIVGAAFDEAFGLLVVIGAKLGEGGGAGDVEIFIGGPDGAGDEARFGGGGILVGDVARQFGGGEVQLVGAVFEFVIGKGDAGAAEGIGLDDVGAGFEVLAVDIPDDVGACDVENFGTVLAAPGSRSRWKGAPGESWCPWLRRGPVHVVPSCL